MMGPLTEKDAVLQVKDLSIFYKTRRRTVKAVERVSFEVFPDEIFGLVGESGSGKSTLCYGLLRLTKAPGWVESGFVRFKGRNILDLEPEELRRLRWKEISFIPQGAMSSLNPVVRVRDQMIDVVSDHEGRQQKAVVNERIDYALEQVNLPGSVASKFPHELSGGMKQRVCIAMAVILQPSLVIADEPTSALDVVSQRIVLEMLAEVRSKMKASMILVGHDMALQAQVSDRLGIMYGGHFMEIGTVRNIFEDPQHPYTRRLISSIPSIQKKQDVHQLAVSSFSEAEKARFIQGNALLEVSPGHYVASYD